MASTSTMMIRCLAALLATAAAAAAERLDVDQLESLVPGVGTPLPRIGTNTDGQSVFTNFVAAYNEGQLFILYSGMMTYEKPSAAPFEVTTLLWCNDLVFTTIAGSSDQSVGYSGRCVIVRLTDPDDFTGSGAELSGDHEQLRDNAFVDTFGISAVFVPQMNILQGVLHKHTDNYVRMFWDDGRPAMAMNGWETHDDGDNSPTALTSSWSNAATCRWLSVEQTASLLQVETTDLAPDKFSGIYEQVWNKMNNQTMSSTAGDNIGHENENSYKDPVEQESGGEEDSDKNGSSNNGQIPGRRRLSIIPEPSTLFSIFLKLFGL
uniref:Uncharacterized protein n=1 Tax=Minutocellus polymorphus TaxID=265543 RepID=A0A7S0AM91_9STRA|mmetsp:Transcript_1704/g.2822  ORF Transcript_1704/g.2822 Transcript_1704/m.2822 type:complete len:321 (+) Transcript_1704:92-1054(+)